MSASVRFTRMGAVLGSIALLAVSACGVDPAGEPKAGQFGGAGQSAPPAVPEPPRAEFITVDQGLVAGLTTVTYADPKRNVDAAVPNIPGARTLTSALEVVRERALRTATQQGASAVKIKADIIAAGPAAVGVEVTQSITGQQGERVDPVVVWYDPGADRAYSSPILIDARQWGTFKGVVAKAAGNKVDAKRLSQALDAEAAPQGTGPALGFDQAGNLVAKFPAGAVTDKPMALSVPVDAVAPVLSTYGRAALEATRTPSKYDPKAPAPSAVPSTSASTSPTPAGNQVPRPSTAVGVDCSKVECVALTYDDGPGPLSHRVVEALTKAGGAATFFQLGQMIDANPEAAHTIASAGMEVASHSTTHPNLATIGADKLNRELDSVNASMEKTYGRRPLLLRPPYGSHNQKVDDAAAGRGLAIIQWSVDTNDWSTKSTASTEASASLAKGGSVVLMHDIHDFTVAATPGIVRDLTAKGKTLVTVSELSVNTGAYKPGRGYCTSTAQPQSGFLCKG